MNVIKLLEIFLSQDPNKMDLLQLIDVSLKSLLIYKFLLSALFFPYNFWLNTSIVLETLPRSGCGWCTLWWHFLCASVSCNPCTWAWNLDAYRLQASFFWQMTPSEVFGFSIWLSLHSWCLAAGVRCLRMLMPDGDCKMVTLYFCHFIFLW